VKWKVAPRPISLSAQMRPPSSRTKWEEMARPSPVPPCVRVVDTSACSKGSKGSKIVLELVVRDADAGVPHGELDELLSSALFARGVVRHAPNLQRDRALRGELQGVPDQVDEQLAKANRIAAYQRGNVP